MSQFFEIQRGSYVLVFDIHRGSYVLVFEIQRNLTEGAREGNFKRLTPTYR